MTSATRYLESVQLALPDNTIHSWRKYLANWPQVGRWSLTTSGLVQAFVSKSQMKSVPEGHHPKTVVRASFFGMNSFSCSYAASALGNSFVSRTADFSTCIVFMLASTNLVIELGLVLPMLIGWQFALAEFDMESMTKTTLRVKIASRQGWKNEPGFTMGDFIMLQKTDIWVHLCRSFDTLSL